MEGIHPKFISGEEYTLGVRGTVLGLAVLNKNSYNRIELSGAHCYLAHTAY